METHVGKSKWWFEIFGIYTPTWGDDPIYHQKFQVPKMEG